MRSKYTMQLRIISLLLVVLLLIQSSTACNRGGHKKAEAPKPPEPKVEVQTSNVTEPDAEVLSKEKDEEVVKLGARSVRSA